jgi:hypothetical protein
MLTAPTDEPRSAVGSVVGPADEARTERAHSVPLVRRREWPGEAQLMSIRIVEMKVALTPRCIPGRGRRCQPSSDDTAIHGVDVVDPEDDSAPAGVRPRVACAQLEVDMSAASPQAREPCPRSPIRELETEHKIERHGRSHVCGHQRHRADALDRVSSRRHPARLPDQQDHAPASASRTCGRRSIAR